MAKKSGMVTKGQAAAQEAAEKMGAVIVPTGNGGFTLVNKAEAQRRKLIDKAAADLAAQDASRAAQAASIAELPTALPIPAPAGNPTGKKSKKAQAQPDASVATPWRGIDPATISKNPGATIAEHPDGQKFCKHHNTTHPATLEFFASNVTAKDGLFSICKLAEKALRDAKKATAQAATPSAEPSNIIPLAATSAPAAKGKKAKK